MRQEKKKKKKSATDYAALHSLCDGSGFCAKVIIICTNRLFLFNSLNPLRFRAFKWKEIIYLTQKFVFDFFHIQHFFYQRNNNLSYLKLVLI